MYVPELLVPRRTLWVPFGWQHRCPPKVASTDSAVAESARRAVAFSLPGSFEVYGSESANMHWSKTVTRAPQAAANATHAG